MKKHLAKPASASEILKALKISKKDIKEAKKAIAATTSH